VIRNAAPADLDEIAAVTRAAFHTGSTDKAERIVREVEPVVSLVWEEGGRILGHTMLSRMRLGERRPCQLSPVSVHPGHQGRGIGSAIVREALRRADALGEPFVLVLGHPGYYPSFGFEPATPLGILAPGAFGDAWMLARLSAWDGAIRGRVEFPPAFD
jgi:putative acetyltransferase